MLIGYILLGALGVWLLWRFWPVKGLNFIDPNTLCDDTELPKQVIKLDIRDASFYQECHMNGSINISLGRLPFVWRKELSPEEPVLILSDSKYTIKKAARMLRRRGFQQLYALRGDVCRVKAIVTPCLD
ncbi:rhodanese-like domain-containing protein [Paenibacillus puldeungensis]|uniref:Rhodanese-like domain-containing protein n=1 Tax=Paenibacillus puldeungensis TaxID=696536 RepID=A0ABW3RYT2_9BACL